MSMSMSAAPSSAAHYGPVPSESDDLEHPMPPSTWANSPRAGSPSGYSLPASDFDDGPPRPRFMGAAAAAPGDPAIRDSVASSSFLNQSDAHSADALSHSPDASVYALQEMPPRRTQESRFSTYSQYRDDPADTGASAGSPAPMAEKRAAYAPRAHSKKKLLLLGGGAAALVVIALAVAIPAALLTHKHHSANNAAEAAAGDTVGTGTAGSGSTKTAGGSKHAAIAVTGGDGSTVTTDDGSTFKYANQFGGYWYYDPNDVFNNAAKCNSWTPALNETFKFGSDRIFGVNLGGWLNTEPFIAPALYEKYLNNTTPAVDEWTLSQAMAADTAGGGLSQLETHYKTFVTEQDFAQIAAAGLNFVRIPLPYWAIETRENEPFLAKTAWTYFLKAIQWARKYGIRINLDLHTLPGSQNGWNHSGKLGSINMLVGPMGFANAQRSLDYIRILAEFVAQPEYRDVVAMLGVTNEPRSQIIGQENIERYYVQAYNIVRAASGAGNNPWISYHEAFAGLSNWVGFLPGADRIGLDQHPYVCFNGQPSGSMESVMGKQNDVPCKTWGKLTNASMDDFGMTAAGEFSLAVTDCGQWVNGVNLGTRYEGTYNDGGDWPRQGSCDPWVQWQSWDAKMKQNMQTFAVQSMDALQNWFFWNWKIGNSSQTGTVMAPAWSYQLGLENGWIPADPRGAAGACGNANPRSSTGLPSASGIPASATASLGWPPASITGAGAPSTLPAYTPTGALVTLPGPTFAAPSGQPAPTATPQVGSGWNNAGDSAGMMVPVPTCSYLDPWIGSTAAVPSPLCGGAAPTSAGSRRTARAYPAAITPAPRA